MVVLLGMGQALAEPIKPTCPDRPIRVGYFEYGILFSAERGSPRGFGMDRDLAFELEKRSGCRFEGDLMARARIWVELREGRLDMTLSAIKTPEREEIGWMYPYAIGYPLVLVSAKAPPAARELNAFLADRELKFGIVRGFRHSAFYDGMIEKLRAQDRIVEAVDEMQLATMVKHGSVSAIVSLPAVYPRYFSDQELGKDVFLSQWDPRNEPVVGHLLLSRKNFNAAEAEKWQALLEELQRDGTMLAIGMRYLGKETARRLMLPAPKR